MVPFIRGSGCWWYNGVGRRCFLWNTLGPLVHNVHILTAYLSIVAEPVYPFMSTVCSSCNGYFHRTLSQSSNHLKRVSCIMSLLSSNGLHRHQTSIQHLWAVVERTIGIVENRQQLTDAIVSIWTKICEECSLDNVESMLRRMKAVLKAKGGLTRY